MLENTACLYTERAAHQDGFENKNGVTGLELGMYSDTTDAFNTCDGVLQLKGETETRRTLPTVTALNRSSRAFRHMK